MFVRVVGLGQTGPMTNETPHAGEPQQPADVTDAADAVADPPVADPTDAGDDGDEITTMVEQPAKVMRIGTMIKQLLEEVRAAPLDEAGRQRLREIHDLSIHELEEGLAPELRDELERFTLPFGDSVPSEAELRIAQAQLVGWLEGLFHGIQTALFAQQMAARAQLEEMRRRALPGAPGGPVIVGPGGQIIPSQRFGQPSADEGGHGTGQYL
ncbi:MAG TPA: bacterial proteasome activator family protein [Jatrophihabitantaceae bacterium]